MASSQHPHSADEAAPQFLMAHLEDPGPGYKPATAFPNSSSSSASSPTESEYLTHTDILGRIPPPAPCSQAPGSLRRHLPLRFIRSCEKYALWLKGPQPPRKLKIRPICSRIQTVSIRLINRWAAKYYQRFWVLLGYYILWLLLFVTIIYKSTSRDGFGADGPLVKLSCISRLW
jgi:hypothetical protein